MASSPHSGSGTSMHAPHPASHPPRAPFFSGELAAVNHPPLRDRQSGTLNMVSQILWPPATPQAPSEAQLPRQELLPFNVDAWAGLQAHSGSAATGAARAAVPGNKPPLCARESARALGGHSVWQMSACPLPLSLFAPSSLLCDTSYNLGRISRCVPGFISPGDAT